MENYNTGERSVLNPSDNLSRVNSEASSIAFKEAYGESNSSFSQSYKSDTASDIFGGLELYEGSEAESDASKTERKQKDKKEEGKWEDDPTEIDRMLQESESAPEKKTKRQITVAP